MHLNTSNMSNITREDSVNIVRDIRRDWPEKTQRGLARRIAKEWNGGGRPAIARKHLNYWGIYHVIRQHDKAEKQRRLALA